MQEHDKKVRWLAEEMEISRSLMGHILTGQRNIQTSHIEKLSKITGIPVKEFLDEPIKEEELYTVKLRGSINSRKAKASLDRLLFVIEDMEDIKRDLEVVKEEITIGEGKLNG